MGKVVPGPKFVSEGTGTETLNFFPPGLGPEFFSRRDWDQNFFLAGTGIKHDWYRSCLNQSMMITCDKREIDQLSL
jgi:hypothetical protein